MLKFIIQIVIMKFKSFEIVKEFSFIQTTLTGLHFPECHFSRKRNFSSFYSDMLL